MDNEQGNSWKTVCEIGLSFLFLALVEGAVLIYFPLDKPLTFNQLLWLISIIAAPFILLAVIFTGSRWFLTAVLNKVPIGKQQTTEPTPTEPAQDQAPK